MTVWTLPNGSRIQLVTPTEFARLPEGTLLQCIDGEVRIKGEHHFDNDVRFGHLAYGIPESTYIGNATIKLIQGWMRNYPERRIKP